MKKINSDCSVVILAAGRSNRMGQPKFAMAFEAGRTFLEEIVARYYSFGCKQIVVVLNEAGMKYTKEESFAFPANTVLVKNSHLEWERFYSIKLGIKTVNDSNPVFIHNVDNPFVNIDILNKLLSFNCYDFVVPDFDGRGGHPILVSEKVARFIINEEQNDLIFSKFLSRFEKTKLAVNDKSILVNINTKEEYDKFSSGIS